MPATLGQLIRNRRRIDISLEDGSSIFIEYRPAALTERLRLEFEAAQEAAHAGTATGEQVITVMRDYLLSVIAAWDILDRNGTVIPLTEAGFRDHVDYEAMTFLMQTIMEDSHMGEANGARPSTPSGSTSSRVTKRATSRRHSRTGTR